MNPEQPSGSGIPGPANQYDFIFNPPPSSPQKSSGNSPLSKVKNVLGAKFWYVIGGAGALIVILFALAIVFSGGNGATASAINIAQVENEIIRVANEGRAATGQNVKNLAISVKLTLTTQQKEWLVFLQKNGETLDVKRLGAKENPQTDKLLTSAKQTSTFDLVFVQTMQNQLKTYSQTLDSAYSKTTVKTERELLRKHFEQTQLLIEQIPEI